MGLYGNPVLTGKERFFEDDEVIVSKTDLQGKITYGNHVFLKLSGFTEQEILGKPHNIIRHPEMPRCVFKLLWDTQEKGEELFAYVNNRSKNGDNYWVFAHITPSYDLKGKLVGYHSNRRVPNRDVLTKHIEPLYQDLLKLEKSYSSPREGMDTAYKKLTDLLEEKQMSFNEFMFSLGV